MSSSWVQIVIFSTFLSLIYSRKYSMWHCKHIGLFSTYIMNLDNGEKGSTTGLLDALNTSIVWLHIRVLSIYVASPATLPVNSATLFYVTRGVATLGSSRHVPTHNFHKILRKICIKWNVYIIVLINVFFQKSEIKKLFS